VIGKGAFVRIELLAGGAGEDRRGGLYRLRLGHHQGMSPITRWRSDAADRSNAEGWAEKFRAVKAAAKASIIAARGGEVCLARNGVAIGNKF